MVTNNKRILKGGMLGGGEGSLIGPAHRSAIIADGEARLVAGLFSRSKEKNISTARAAGVEIERVYDTLDEFIAGEAGRPADDRLDWVTVATPNVAHFDQIRRLVEAGFNVIADKPLTATRQEAEELHRIVTSSGVFFGLTHTYVGYDAIREARRRIADGAIGPLHKIVVEYFQGWLLEHLPATAGAGMPWRTQRAVSGDSCTTADIGTHAAHLVSYVTQLPIERLLASVRSFIPANELEDDVSVIIDHANSVRGVLLASQSSTGVQNGFRLRIFGASGALEWSHSEPGLLVASEVDGTRRTIEVDGSDPGPADAFASLYSEAFRAIRARKTGADPGYVDIPGIDDGLFGMRFVDCVLESDRRGSEWVNWPEGA